MSDPARLHTLNHQKRDPLSVSDFFGQFNWYGSSLLGPESLDIAGNPYETVGQFFSTFPWQQSTTVLPSDDWEAFGNDEVTNPIEDDTLTLEDLSALF
ncbi:MAG: hypothetical protein AAFR24_12170 [Cyanobacteria bacterium J06627_3]